ncbi:ABC transporter ATP-binding protein [Solimicrobium silvestre]|uniref:ABC-type branched-chain amino acid transport systems ATPase component n=1 Tax=Solimicrobium silvestre TaxID=2099400 RepID=A0A2S9H177_9BURK|nr:ABC transporter ATP-binding protein [Solimicrobium silvestre]PRC93718.1 ABC-type branched-chain amino acid transport systems ATPase component [Solimicrobium silvestre]
MILTLTDVHGFYGKSHILQSININVAAGEVVTLLGRNGAGKTTTLKSIVGVVPAQRGKIMFEGEDITCIPTHKIAERGVCLVPEHRGIFKLLTVEENLTMSAKRDSAWKLDDIYRIFPRLKERRNNGGGHLSGGEQQMLAIGRALMTHPKILMLDEPVEGLAPVIVDEIVAQLKLINATGMTILLIEQNLEVCTQLADRHYIIEQGRVVHCASNQEFLNDDAVKDRYLGVNLAA